jgi:hypothetical protein
MKSPREEFDELLKLLTEEERKDFESLPFGEFPIDHFRLQSLLLTIPTIVAKHATLVQKIVKLNSMMGLNDQRSAAEKVIALANEHIIFFFRDQYGRSFAKIKVGDHTELMDLDKKRFKLFLRQLFYQTTRKVIYSDALKNAIDQLQARAQFEGATIELKLRVAWIETGKSIAYDMTDSHWRQIIIDSDGWKLANSDVTGQLFDRYNQTSQVIPMRDYPKSIFDDFLDLMKIDRPNHRLLTKVWIVHQFIPDIAKIMNFLYGEKGAAKSTFSKYEKRLIDPDILELLTIPKDKSEFIQQLSHNYLLVYDNIQHVPYWFPDELARAVTGAGNSKRGLYTNDDDFIARYRRSFIINGINPELNQPDVLDRSILCECARLSPENRREEETVEAEFEEMRPYLLGCILDIVVKALNIKPTLKLPTLPRMASAGTWGEAIARAMGYKPLDFIGVYYENIGEQNVEVLESTLVGQALLAYVNEHFTEQWKEEWNMTCGRCGRQRHNTTDFHNELTSFAKEIGIDIKNKAWPKKANKLSGQLRKIASNLREGYDIDVKIYHEPIFEGKKNVSVVSLSKASLLSPPSPPPENQTRIDAILGGDKTEVEIPLSPPIKVSPPIDSTKRVQESIGGDSGGGGDSFAMDMEGSS